MRNSYGLRFLVGVLLATVACKGAMDVPAGAQLTCGSASDCPGGLICNRGHCANPNSIDTTPPDLVAGSLVVAPARIRAGQSFTVSFQATEPLAAAPVVSLALAPPVGLDCASAGGNAWTCSHTATGSENGGAGGDLAIDVRMQDRAGNDTARSGVGLITMDFVPPVPTIAGVGYAPGPGNPLSTVKRATAGTLVQVSLSADEKLSATATPTLKGRLGPAELPFTFVARGPGDNEVSFQGTVPPLQPDGDYTLEVGWADEVGNVGTAAVPSAVVKVKTSAPTLVVDQNALVFVRSPWGNSADENLGGYTIPAGPYFALEPSDVFTTSAALASATFIFSDTSAPTAVRVQDSGGVGALPLGTIRPTVDGSWPRKRLSSPDLSSVFVVGMDDAGNESGAVRIRNAEWVATTNSPVGASPHTLEWTGYVTSTMVQEAAVHPVTTVEGAGTDTQAILARAEAVWRNRTSTSVPDARYDHAMAYDSARGRVVLFGGYNGSIYVGDTWEWNGSAWTQVATTGPSARGAHAMAYDSARGRVVLFGGYEAGLSVGDTWEWDGNAWTQVATKGPNARGAHAMAYDSARGRVVLFGGYNGSYRFSDTWEWSGSAWTQVATTGPSARYNHAMAYDSARGRVVLFGGLTAGGILAGDNWEWNGSGWVLVASGYGGRSWHAMAYDSARGREVLFGGNSGSGPVGDTWERNSASISWAQVATTGPSARYRHAMAYDSARGQVVLFGGSNGSSPVGDTWVWSGSAWTQVATPGPGARYDHAMAYDSARGRVVLFGGVTASAQAGDTWERNGTGTGWTQVATTGPSARSNHAMAYDSARGRVVLFGGYNGSSAVGDTWEWNGSAWTQVPTTGPSARYFHAMAYDSARGRVVLFGGYNGSSSLGDTWEWSGSAWAQVATTGPDARYLHAMAYDSARGRVVLFGGIGGVGDTWEWSGGVWTYVSNGFGTGPSDRYAHAMAYDTARGRVILFGGRTNNGPVGDTWARNGTTWTQVATTGPSGPTYSAMAYDSARDRVVQFGGLSRSSVAVADTWEYDASPAQQPAIQLDASFLHAGIATLSVAGIRVRAFAGGTYSGSDGATLLGWSTGFSWNGTPGEWLPLAANATAAAAQAPYLPAAPASLIDWRSSSPDEARRFVLERDGRLSFQLRPSGPAGPDPSGSRVALDYIEVRVRYSVP
jgi:hypothetical protein